MQTSIISIIEHQLLKQGELIVPHLGTFRIDYQSARKDEHNCILPPSRTVVLSQTYGENESLIRLFSAILKVDRIVLNQLLASFAQGIYQQLAERGEFCFGRLGKIVIADGNPQFIVQQHRTAAVPALDGLFNWSPLRLRPLLSGQPERKGAFPRLMDALDEAQKLTRSIAFKRSVV